MVKLLPLVKDGDLVALAQYMIRTRGRETVRVTKVKGHAEDSDVQHARVRLVDQLGNAEADTDADLGRRHSLKFSSVLGVGCPRCVVIGTLSSFYCIGL